MRRGVALVETGRRTEITRGWEDREEFPCHGIEFLMMILKVLEIDTGEGCSVS